MASLRFASRPGAAASAGRAPLVHPFSAALTAVLWLAAGTASGLVSFVFGQSQNLMVFRQASRDLLMGEDLYLLHAADYFKYSPTFALLFAPLAALPAWLSAALWGAMNFGAAWAGISAMVSDPQRRERALFFGLFGVLLATDGDQSNLLVLGLFLLALRSLEKGSGMAFALLLAVATSVKVFPILGAAMLLAYPRKWRHVAQLTIAGLVLVALPLLVTSPQVLLRDYGSWRALLARDHGNVGWSVMSMLQKGMGLAAGNTVLQVVSLLLLMAPLVLGVRYGTDAAFRRTFASSVLVFAVIMNHRAEYATYVIFAGAAAVWWSQAKVRVSRTVLVVSAFLAVGPLFTHGDPSAAGLLAVLAAKRRFHPLRVLPPLLVWLWMQRDLYARFFRVSVELRPDVVHPRLTERHAS